MKNTIIVLAVIFILFSSPSIYSQTTIRVVEDVVLFNDQPYVVKMTEKGKIIEFVKDLEKNYAALNAYEGRAIEMSETDVIAAIDLGRKGGNTLDVAAYLEAQKESKAIVSGKTSDPSSNQAAMDAERDENTSLLATADIADNKDEEMVAKGVTDTDDEENTGPSTTKYAYEFAFDHRDASLSPSSVNQLEEIARIMKEDVNTDLKINSYYSESVDISRVLSKNRAKGIHDMLVSNGISSSRIKITESNNEDWSNNRVKVSIH